MFKKKTLGRACKIIVVAFLASPKTPPVVVVVIVIDLALFDDNFLLNS